jgi:hypothetical protein
MGRWRLAALTALTLVVLLLRVRHLDPETLNFDVPLRGLDNSSHVPRRKVLLGRQREIRTQRRVKVLRGGRRGSRLNGDDNGRGGHHGDGNDRVDGDATRSSPLLPPSTFENPPVIVGGTGGSGTRSVITLLGSSAAPPFTFFYLRFVLTLKSTRRNHDHDRP